MKVRDAFGLAVRDVARRLGRAVLTILAVVLAATLLTALVVIATTAKARVIGQLTKGGPLATVRVEGSGLDDAALHRIERLDSVRAVSPVVVAREVVVPPIPPTYRAATNGTSPGAAGDSDGASVAARPFINGVVGIDLSRPDLFPVSVLAGRLPRASSATEVAVTRGYLAYVGVDASDAVRVLGTEVELAAPQFVGTDNDDIWGRWTRATVVGVVAQEAGEGSIVAPFGPVRAAQRFTNAARDPTGRFSTQPYAAFLVEARTLNGVPRAVEEIDALGYSTSAPQSLIANVQRYLHVVEIVLTAVGLIALAIAALGVTSALLAAVRERRREIGVLKAIGARDRDVLQVFLIEASVQGFIGGVIGAAAGWALARTVAAAVNRYLVSKGLVGVKLVAPLPILLDAVAGVTLLALCAGAVPAIRAARLPAREAMGGL
jgi:ABC-type antimicrobial peptide transport system permease subunit